VGDGELPFRYDVEIALVIAEALGALPIPEFRLRINNRKLAEGFYRGIGLTDTAGVLRSIDKLEKIGPEKVAELLKSELGATDEQAQAALKLAGIKTEDTSFAAQVRSLGVSNDLLEEGLNELEQVIEAAVKRVPGKVVADLSIARGLDYYTGTVVETVLVDHEQLGSICSGGRYDALASKGNRKFPGVGLSIGVTRLVSRILSQDLAKASRSVPTAVFVALTSDESWGEAQDVATELRSRGIAAEVAAKAEKFGKQIKFADRRGIPFVWFTDEDGKHQVKDIRSGVQVDADPATWTPSEDDIRVQVIAAPSA
jgi:histidyl-tRNA synthetase